jgi:iron complex outermembrane recepter protein
VRRSFLTTDDQFATQGVIPALLLRPNNPNYATAANYLNANGQGALVGQTLAITSRVFDFGPRTTKDTATQSRFTGGFRGQVAGQDYEAAYSHNESKTEGTVIDGFFSQVEYAKIVNDPNSDWNPWSLTQSAAFNAKLPAAKYIGPTLNATSKSDVVDGKITGEAFSLPAGPSQYAAGVQFRKESYVTQPSDALGTGDIAGLGGSVPPVNRSRRINALYGELNVPIVKNLEGNLAVRGDQYNDVGNATTYKASIRWQPTSAFLLRSAIGTGFRAPTLTDLWTPQTLGTSEQFNDPLTGQKNVQVNALSGGNPNLKPEKSTQGIIGLVVQPTQAFSVGLDFFKVKIRDAINSPSAQEVVSGYRTGNPTYANAVRLTASGDINDIDIVTVNSGEVNVSGVDLDARYRFKFDAGRLDLSLNGTYITQYDETSPGGVVSHKVDTIVDPENNPVIGSNGGGVILRWKHVLTATWTQGPWSFSFAQNYANGYRTANRQIDDEKNFMSSQSLYDAYVSYSGIKNLKLAVGVKNLLNSDPPGVFVPVSNQFQSGYDVTQYDARARYVFLTLGYKFF